MLAPGTPLYRDETVKSLIRFLGEMHHARIWLTDETGNPVIQSFTGPIPGELLKDIKKCSILEGKSFYHTHFRKHRQFYAMIDLDASGNTFTLHILFKRADWHVPGRQFALGLLGIGFVIALLVLPVSRRVTGPLKKLEQSAQRIAEGDLSHRAAVSGKDEIGQLSHAFNRMAGKVERMVRGGRELTANVSHELRSPLARIGVAAELMEERLNTIGDRTLNRYIGNILDGVQRGSTRGLETPCYQE